MVFVQLDRSASWSCWCSESCQMAGLVVRWLALASNMLHQRYTRIYYVYVWFSYHKASQLEWKIWVCYQILVHNIDAHIAGHQKFSLIWTWGGPIGPLDFKTLLIVKSNNDNALLDFSSFLVQFLYQALSAGKIHAWVHDKITKRAKLGLNN